MSDYDIRHRKQKKNKSGGLCHRDIYSTIRMQNAQLAFIHSYSLNDSVFEPKHETANSKYKSRRSEREKKVLVRCFGFRFI